MKKKPGSLFPIIWRKLSTDAHEGIEVFLNGISLGIQVVPLYHYILEDGIRAGVNRLRIEAATTLSREMAKLPNAFGQIKPSDAKSGITGNVILKKT